MLIILLARPNFGPFAEDIYGSIFRDLAILFQFAAQKTGKNIMYHRRLNCVIVYAPLNLVQS